MPQQDAKAAPWLQALRGFTKLCVLQTDFCGCCVLCTKPQQLSSPTAVFLLHSSFPACCHEDTASLGLCLGSTGVSQPWHSPTAVTSHPRSFLALTSPLAVSGSTQPHHRSLVSNCRGNKKEKTLSGHSYAATVLQYEVDTLWSLLGCPKMCRVQKKDIQKVKPHSALEALKCDLQASPQPLMGQLCTLHKLS